MSESAVLQPALNILSFMKAFLLFTHIALRNVRRNARRSPVHDYCDCFSAFSV